MDTKVKNPTPQQHDTENLKYPTPITNTHKKCIRVGIVRLSSFGDVVVSASLLAGFRAALTQLAVKLDSSVRIEWFIDERFSGILADSPAIDVLHALPMRTLKTPKSVRTMWQFLRGLGEFDIVLDLQGLIKSALVGKALRGKQFVGFSFLAAREGLASLAYNKRVQIPYDSNILVRNFAIYTRALELCGANWHVLEALDSSLDSRTPESRETAKLEAIFRQEIPAHSKDSGSLAGVFARCVGLRAGGFGADMKLARAPVSTPESIGESLDPVLDPGIDSLDSSVYRVLFVLEASIAQKTYPLQHFAMLATLMQRTCGACEFYLIYHSAKERALELRAMLHASCLHAHLLPPLDFTMLKLLLKRMDCVIGGDTGVTHLAWALGSARVITLLGNAATTSGKNMSQTKLSRVLLGNPIALSQSGSFEIASITPQTIHEIWKTEVLKQESPGKNLNISAITNKPRSDI